MGFLFKIDSITFESFYKVRHYIVYEIEKDKNDKKFSSTKDLGYKHRLMIL